MVLNSLAEGSASVLCFYRRFFASSYPTGAESNDSKENPDDSEKSDHAPSLAAETHSTQRKTESSPQRASLSAFSWSGSSTEPSRPGPSTSDLPRTPSMPSGLAVLQQFQRKKESINWRQIESPQRCAPCSPPEGAVDSETPPTSPPSQDSAYFSQACSGHSTSEDSTLGTHSTATSPETVREWDTGLNISSRCGLVLHTRSVL